MFWLGLIAGAAVMYGGMWLAAKGIEEGWWR